MDPLSLARQALAARQGVFVVGGRVRDALLGRPTLDTDIVVESGALDTARRLAHETGGAFVALDEARDVARVVWPAGDSAVLDVVGFTGPTIDDDLRNRDLTINALAVPLSAPWPPTTDSVIDPTGGLVDLEKRLIRVTSPGALDADPLRMLRTVRFAAELAFELHPATVDEVRARKAQIHHAAPERVRDELLKTLATPRCAEAIQQLDDYGLLTELLPEVVACKGVRQSPPHTDDVLVHSVAVVEALAALQGFLTAQEAGPDIPVAWLPVIDRYRDRLVDHLRLDERRHNSRWVMLRFAALLHDTGKPATASENELGRIQFIRHESVSARLAEDICTRLRLSARETAYVCNVVRYHPRPLALARSGGASRRAVYRFFADTGPDGVDVVLHALADNVVKAPLDNVRAEGLAEVVASLLHGWFDAQQERVDPEPLVTGGVLMEALRIEPGPEVGRLLSAIREGQAAGDISDADQALELARHLHASR